MTKEFIPYEYALELKELGFDEQCLAFYNGKYLDSTKYDFDTGSIKDIGQCNFAPTFSQAFRWFREKYGFYYTIWPEFYRDGINFNWQILWYLPKDEWTKYVISDGTGQYGDNGEYPSQEEAELACLIKLIEIVKDADNTRTSQ
jgi:hypothetical protein